MPAPYLDVATDGTFGVLATQTFLQDCDWEAIEQGHLRLVRQSVAVTTQPVSAAPWQDISST